MKPRYRKLILAMPYQALADGRTVLINLINAYLEEAAKQEPLSAKPAAFWLRPVPTQEWLCKRLLRLLEKQDLATFIHTLNTSLKLPAGSEAYKILSAFFSFFPEHLSALHPTVENNLTIDFRWLRVYFDKVIEEALSQLHTAGAQERTAACQILQNANSAVSKEQAEQIIYAILPIATNHKEHNLAKLRAFETLGVIAANAVDYIKNFIIDTMLDAISQDNFILNIGLLPLLATLTRSAQPEKITAVMNQLLPYLQSSDVEMRKAAINAVEGLDPRHITREMRIWRKKIEQYSKKLSHPAPVEIQQQEDNPADWAQQVISLRKNSLAKPAPLPLDIMKQLARMTQTLDHQEQLHGLYSQEQNQSARIKIFM